MPRRSKRTDADIIAALEKTVKVNLTAAAEVLGYSTANGLAYRLKNKRVIVEHVVIRLEDEPSVDNE